jgi:hypothetical protein
VPPQVVCRRVAIDLVNGSLAVRSQLFHIG